MTLTELEIRVATLEQQLAQLLGDADTSGKTNAWIDEVHGTFPNDAAYRRAARLGREWRKSQGRPGKSRSRKIAGK